jgi:hypothetical protein
MPSHEYTSQQALELLLRKLTTQETTLAQEVQTAIDAGKDVEKDVEEAERAIDRRRKPRVYRRTIPLSFEEALQVAINVLQAHFVEQPLFVSSQADNFSKAAIAIPAQQNRGRGTGNLESEDLSMEAEGMEKAVEVEVQPETRISTGPDAPIPLKKIPEEQINEQLRNIQRLRDLTDFTVQ